MKNLGSKYPKVEILWADAATVGEGLYNEEEVKGVGAAGASTIGHLAGEDRETITLIMTHFYQQALPEKLEPEHGLRFIWVIPRGCIRAMYELKRGRKRL